MRTVTALGIVGIWFYLCAAAAADGFGATWWRWPLAVGTATALVIALAREDLRSRRMRRSWERNMPRVIGTDVPVKRTMAMQPPARPARAVPVDWHNWDPWADQ